ncbi:hypothetical protein N7501_005209 [Penicillium viridicatum]|nr:hypothetical protein N7501_005209 [Penicillium viridicatum]
MPKKRLSREEGCAVDHGNCFKFLKAEEQDHKQNAESAEQPTAHLNQPFQLLVAEIAQLPQQLAFERNKPTEESHQLKSKVFTLTQSLEAASSEGQVMWKKHQRQLDGLLHYPSSSNLDYDGYGCQLAGFQVQIPQGIISVTALHLGSADERSLQPPQE